MTGAGAETIKALVGLLLPILEVLTALLSFSFPAFFVADHPPVSS